MSGRHLVFIDFDGTITENDVGYEMFKKFTFAATEPLVQSYRRGEINSRDCLAQECAIWNNSAPNPDEVFAYLESQPIRQGFDQFLGSLKEYDIAPTIISEGFNFYIDRFLAFHNLSHLARITNIAQFLNGKLSPQFPYYKLGCDTCSSCKGYHIGRLRPLSSSAIYIGDGHSDLHASHAADIVFARSHLASIMTDENRYFIEYANFHEILNQLEPLISKGIFTQSARLNFCYFSERHYRSLQSLWENGEVMKNVGYPDGLGHSQSDYAKAWQRLISNRFAIYLALENKSGEFIGEAKIAFPALDGHCRHDLKLLPAYQGIGLGFEAWNIILNRSRVRWPNAIPLVTPSAENKRAIALYLKLGFRFNGDIQTWTPPAHEINARPILFRNMIKS
jgi:2-hydroxy-3-keto-5-methylthiopentenyl-1-phosphate phosphatase